MKIVINRRKSEDTIASFVIAMLMTSAFTLSGTTDTMFIFLFLLIGFVYIFQAAVKTKSKIFNYIATLPGIWFMSVSLMIFLYGFFGKYKVQYSLIYHVTNMIYVLFICFILYYKRKKLLDIFTNSCIYTIALVSIYLFINDFDDLLDAISKIISGNSYYRFGDTGAGNVNLTAMAYAFLLIPIVYQIFRKKNLVRNFIILGLAGVIILLTGSKKGVFALAIIFFCMAFFYHKTKLLNIIKIACLMLALLVVLRDVPLFYNLIWVRMEAMVQTLVMMDITDGSSTSLRLNYIVTVLKTFWDKPILGHGWYSFAYIHGDGMYSHCNYTEILFSCGIIGLLLYYWFPFHLTMRLGKSKSEIKPLLITYLAVLLFFDFGAVTFYQTLFAYLGFGVVYLLLKTYKESLGYEY